MLARRMINSLPMDCTLGCGLKTQRGNLQSHLLSCPNKPYDCGIMQDNQLCSFSGNKQDFLNHLMESHAQEVLKKIS